MVHATMDGTPRMGNKGVLRVGNLGNEENRTVKRTLILLAGLATLVTGVYFGRQVFGQGGGQPVTAPLQSKIALVNLGQVIKNYDKFKNYQAQLKTELGPIQGELDKRKGDIVAKETEMNKPETAQQRRDQLQREIKATQREMQDKIDDMNTRTSKQNVAMMQMVYKDVQDAVAAYARAYAIELVLQYTDAVDPAEKTSPRLLEQKLANNACYPLYMDPRMDISNYVTQMLNEHIKKASHSQPNK